MNFINAELKPGIMESEHISRDTFRHNVISPIYQELGKCMHLKWSLVLQAQ